MLAVVVTAFSQAVLSSTTASVGLQQMARIESLATAGTRLAALELAERKASRASVLSPDRRSFHCRLPPEEPGSLLIRIEDEGGKVDLNTASADLLHALLTGVGATTAEASHLADRIIDFRSAIRRTEPGQAFEKAAARPNEAAMKRVGFDAVEEIEQVPGMPQLLLVRLAPYITVHNRHSGIDPAVAAPRLARALTVPFVAGPELDDNSRGVDPPVPFSLPAKFASPSEHRYFRIRVTARLMSGERFTRDAIVDLGSPPGEPPRFERWMKGLAPDSKTLLPELASLPSC